MIFLRSIWLFCLLTCSLQAQTCALVTGGAGFLGSHLCEKLLNEGYKIICVDNVFTGGVINIEHLLSNPYFSFKNQDVTLPFNDISAVDEIYNLACPASPEWYQKDPIQTIRTSVLGALNVLELAERCHAKIFQASTSEVYGDPLEHPQKESYWGHVNPIGIRACYDEGKRCAETLFFEFHRTRGVTIKVGRIFNTYGPRMSKNDGRVVSNFIVQAMNNQPITIYGTGEQTRSFCYVDDLIDAIYLFMKTEDDVTGPLNLGNSDEYTVKELAESIIQKTGSSSQVVFLPLPKDDPQQRKPDMTLTEKTLNWIVDVDLDTGLDRTIDYFKTPMMTSGRKI
jgi:UDP-glucuronate decarboxylase